MGWLGVRDGIRNWLLTGNVTVRAHKPSTLRTLLGKSGAHASEMCIHISDRTESQNLPSGTLASGLAPWINGVRIDCDTWSSVRREYDKASSQSQPDRSRVAAMTNSHPASDMALNRAVAVRPRNVWRLPVLAGCAALAFGIAACSQTPNGGNVGTTSPGIQATPAELREIVKDAYVYGFPMVDSYRIQHSYFVDATNPEFKGAWNQPHSVARVFTPQDKAIQTPNSDTPYTFLGADLRAEPLVISVPAIPKDRYYSLQFIDMYTHNFAYVGSRATGNEAGHYLLAGPA